MSDDEREQFLQKVWEALGLGAWEYEEYEIINGAGTVMFTFKYPRSITIHPDDLHILRFGGGGNAS